MLSPVALFKGSSRAFSIINNAAMKILGVKSLYTFMIIYFLRANSYDGMSGSKRKEQAKVLDAHQHVFRKAAHTRCHRCARPTFP